MSSSAENLDCQDDPECNRPCHKKYIKCGGECPEGDKYDPSKYENNEEENDDIIDEDNLDPGFN